MPFPADSRLDRLIQGLVQYRLSLLAVAILLTVVAWPSATRLVFDQSIEALYSQDNPRLKACRESRALFGGDELILVAWRDPELYDAARDEFRSERLELITGLSTRLSKVAGIDARATQDLASSVGRAQGLRRIPGLGTIDRQIRSLSRGILLGDDNQTTAVVLRLQPATQTSVPRGESIAQVRAVAAEFEEETHLKPYVVGEPVQVHDMFRYVEDDGLRLGMWSSVLLLAVIFGLFRNARWTLAPVAVVWTAIVWTRGLLVLFHFQLSMVSSMLTSLVTIIGVATVIHLVVRYQELRAKLPPEEALRSAFVQLAPAIFWTCATTAAGFGAQLSSHIHPVASFGLMMSLGTMLVLPAIGCLVPAAALCGSWPVDPRPAPAAPALARGLKWLADLVEQHPGRVWLALAVLAVATAAGCARLTIETDFSRNFRSGSPILDSLDFVESNLGGAGSWEVNFSAPPVIDEPFLERVRTLAGELRSIREGDGTTRALTKVLALSDGIELIPRIPLVIPDVAARMRLLTQLQPEFIDSLYNPGAQRMRIVLRSHERKRSEEKLRLIAEAERLTRSAFPETRVETQAQATGLHVLLAYLTDSLLRDQWTSFALASTVIAGMMTLAYRSFRVGILALIPNLLAIGLVIGVMGWLALPINIGTAMIASVAMGLTVDSSIHYLSGLRRELAGDTDFAGAIVHTQQQVGSALIYANLALVAGFLVLVLSNFIPLVYFGILCSVAMAGGLLGNLVVLPLMLHATGGMPRPRPRTPATEAPKHDTN